MINVTKQTIRSLGNGICKCLISLFGSIQSVCKLIHCRWERKDRTEKRKEEESYDKTADDISDNGNLNDLLDLKRK